MIEKISDYKWVIPKEGSMRVPAYVFASDKLLSMMKNDNTLSQLSNVACLPGVYKQALCMPDGHQGYGFPIGGVAALDFNDGGISPGGIGYDINCGVRLLQTNLTKKEVLPKINDLINSIYRNVPCGVGEGGIMGKLSDADLKSVLNEGSEWALSRGYATQDDLERTEESGRLNADASNVSQRAMARGRDQLGSLGAGNHFLEIQAVDEILDKSTAKSFGVSDVNQVTVMIHCGSRGLGHQVCSDYLRDMEKGYPEIVGSLPDRELIYAPAGSKLAGSYLSAMNAAANFAWANRQLIAHQIRKAFSEVFPASELKQVYDVCHNICKVEEYDGKKFYLHRKGATRCVPKGHSLVPKPYKNAGQPVIIPGTMGTASYLLVGLESCVSESFMSTAHGAGRVMSRHEAIKSLPSDSVRKELSDEGILLKARSMVSVSEEAPRAYKDVDEVVRVSEMAGIAKRVARVKPLGVIKG